MTEAQYKGVKEAFLSYFLSRADYVQGLYEYGDIINKIGRTAGIKPSDREFDTWTEEEMRKVFDSFVYNSEDADKCDNRTLHKSYWEHMEAKAMTNIEVFRAGKIDVGDIMSIVSTGVVEASGMNINLDCGLGCCAERVALMQALSMGYKDIKYVFAMNYDGDVVLPCGACIEFMRRLEVKELWVSVDRNLWMPLEEVDNYARIYGARK